MHLKLSPFKNTTVAVALSGGMDSVALFHYIYTFKDKYNICLKAVNVEHKIRGASSLSDSAFVRKLCEDYKIPCLSYSVDAPLYSKTHKLSLESAARQLRYDCFYDVLNTGAADFIATAHHMSDNAESVLFNILRGSGLKGASGIAPQSGKIVRPMLGVSKPLIKSYAEKHSLLFVTDESNYDDTYTRNHLRLNIMPQLKKAFPACESALAQFAASASEDDAILQKLSEKLLIFEENCAKITFCGQKPLFIRAVIHAVKNLGQPLDYTSKQLLSVYALQHKKNGSVICLNGGLRAVCDYGKITIYKETVLDGGFNEAPFAQGKTRLSDSLTVCVLPCGITAETFFDGKPGRGELIFDFEKIPAGAVFRKRQTGDIFKPCNKKTKSLKKYLIEKKVPERMRDGLYIIAKDNTVLAVLEHEISDIIKVDNNSAILYNIKTTKGE